MFYLCLFLFFYSTLVLRNYRTDSHQIFRNCVFWCSLNNPVVLKFFGRHLAEKNAKNSEIWSKFHGLTQIFDNNFETVKDNSNLKQTWTRGIVSLHFWKISSWTVHPFAQLGEKICILDTLGSTRYRSRRYEPSIVGFRPKNILIVFWQYLSHLTWGRVLFCPPNFGVPLLFHLFGTRRCRSTKYKYR